MIAGIGTDILDARRIQKLLSRFDNHFKQKVFTQAEQNYCDKQHQPYLAYAKRFAAKEAFLKALGTGMRKGVAWHDIEIKRTSLGQPFIVSNLLKKHQNCFLSLSDETPYVVAYVIIESSLEATYTA